MVRDTQRWIFKEIDYCQQQHTTNLNLFMTETWTQLQSLSKKKKEYKLFLKQINNLNTN